MAESEAQGLSRRLQRQPEDAQSIGEICLSLIRTTTIMKSLNVILWLVSLAVATPLSHLFLAGSDDSEQSSFRDAQSHPGCDLVLHELRIVQFEEQAPQVMSEFEKVRVMDPYTLQITSHSIYIDQSEGSRSQVL